MVTCQDFVKTAKYTLVKMLKFVNRIEYILLTRKITQVLVLQFIAEP